MAQILLIETSDKICSAALEKDGKIIVNHASDEVHSHASKLPEYVQYIMDLLRSNGEKPDAVAVSAGPGSYTGLRIGVSTAKGLCYGFGIPMIAIDTLQLMAETAMQIDEIKGNMVCPMVDARRMEVYTTLYDSGMNHILEPQAMIIDETSFADELQKGKIYFCGNGSDKCSSVIKHDNAIFLQNIEPKAENMAGLAELMYKNKTFVDIAYYEPNYIKEFQATTPKNKINQ